MTCSNIFKREKTFFCVLCSLILMFFSIKPVFAAEKNLELNSEVSTRSATYLSKGGMFTGQETIQFYVPSSTSAKVILSVRTVSGDNSVGLTVSSSTSMVLNAHQTANGDGKIYYNVPLSGNCTAIIYGSGTYTYGITVYD